MARRRPRDVRPSRPSRSRAGWRRGFAWAGGRLSPRATQVHRRARSGRPAPRPAQGALAVVVFEGGLPHGADGGGVAVASRPRPRGRRVRHV